MADTPYPTLIDLKPDLQSVRSAVLSGLGTTPKSLPAWLFYDATGSMLFERICEQPEYYPTRTELAILHTHGTDIAREIGDHCTLVELGSGSPRKASMMLRQLRRPDGYIAIDVSLAQLRQTVTALAREFPRLPVTGVCADFSESDGALPLGAPADRLIGFFPGSTIGNMTPEGAEAFLRHWSVRLHGGGMLVGVDLVKDTAVLDAAYNDAAGITAAFNRNILDHVRWQLDTDIDPGRFEHRAFFDEARSRVEMHLVARERHDVHVERYRITFARGETIHTENSCKYTVEGFQQLAERAGFKSRRVWTDERHWFSVHYLEAAGER